MSLIRLQRNILRRVPTSKFSTALTESDEYTATPNYPPILDLSYEKIQERKKEVFYEEIKAVKTVEEKQIKLNMPKYYGFKCYMFLEDKIPYGQLQLTQHITRTHLIIKDKLPEYYNSFDTESIFKDIKEELEEALIIEHGHYKRKYEVFNDGIDKLLKDKLISQAITRRINRVLLNGISRSFPHLKDTQTDYDPRIESFWFVGGMNPPQNIKRYRRGVDWLKHTENDPTNRAIQYIGTPLIQLRSKLPLLPIIPYDEASNADFTVPYFKYDPRVVGVATVHRHMVNTPGFWPGDHYEHGMVSYHTRTPQLNRNFNDESEKIDAVHRQGILASFGWLNALANYFGFTTFNDITYPLVTQSIITNGKIWSFYVYQLNTLLNHSQYVTGNTKRNICWATPELKLFEEIKDGKIIGLNDDVLKMLVQYYVNEPQERLGLNMKPYLDQKYNRVADYEDDDKRNWLEREYKHLMANRERYKLMDELYHWEKIYKVDHKTRPHDSLKRPFELKQKLTDRRLNDRQAFYIPRAARPDLPRHKGRYAKEYFP